MPLTRFEQMVLEQLNEVKISQSNLHTHQHEILQHLGEIKDAMATDANLRDLSRQLKAAKDKMKTAITEITQPSA